jgi:hypothetical protein
MKIRLIAAAVVLAAAAAVFAQDATVAPAPAQSAPQPPADRQGPRGGRGGWGGGMGGRGVLGTVTEVAADHFTVRTETAETYTIHYSVNTRIMKAPTRRPGGAGDSADAGDGQRFAPQMLKPTDIKVGDAITAGGEIDAAAHSVGAIVIMQLDPEQAKRAREMQANYGKTWVMGRVTAIDGVKVTMQGGPDNAVHTVVADENTTFRKRRDPITLGDIQVGDAIRVEGGVKDGAFLASTVSVMGQQGPPPSPPPAGALSPAPPK